MWVAVAWVKPTDLRPAMLLAVEGRVGMVSGVLVSGTLKCWERNWSSSS